MKLFILPFLIAANHQMQNKPENYKNGTEVSFNVTHSIKFTGPNIKNTDVYSFLPRYVTYDATSEMKCQYDTPKYLHCYMANSILNETLYFDDWQKNFSEIHNHTNLSETLGSVEFIIKFNKYGVQDILVPDKMDERNYDELKIIIHTLHTGIDPERGPGSYDNIDMTLTGNCSTHFEVVGYGAREIDSYIQQNYSLNGKPIVINKKRIVDMCDNKIYRSYVTRTMNDNVTMDVVSSESFMKATDDNFEASITWQGQAPVLLVTTDEIPFIKFHGNTRVIYDSVEPAKNKFEAIDNPKPLGLILGEPVTY